MCAIVSKNEPLFAVNKEALRSFVERFNHTTPLGAPECPLCKARKWGMNPANGCVALPNAEHGGASLNNMPFFFVVSCQQCGNTHLINPLVLGLTKESLGF